MQQQVLELFSSLSVCVTVKWVPVPASLDMFLVFLMEVQMALGGEGALFQCFVGGSVCSRHISDCCESPVSYVVTWVVDCAFP